jgi:endo-alpha-1,4-polygalactosaminidase (GH114 family)
MNENGWNWLFLDHIDEYWYWVTVRFFKEMEIDEKI